MLLNVHFFIHIIFQHFFSLIISYLSFIVQTFLPSIFHSIISLVHLFIKLLYSSFANSISSNFFFKLLSTFQRITCCLFLFFLRISSHLFSSKYLQPLFFFLFLQISFLQFFFEHFSAFFLKISSIFFSVSLIFFVFFFFFA